MKAEESLVYSFYVLFLISFMGSWEMLFATGLLIIIGSIIVLKKFRPLRLLLPVLPFMTLMCLPMVISALLGVRSNDQIFYLRIVYKLGISSVVLSTLIEKYSSLYLLDGILALGLPNVLNTIFALTFRYFYMIESDVQIGNKAMKSRGIQNRKGLSIVFIFGEWIGGFFLKSSIHAELVHQAMLSRGFGLGSEKIKRMSLKKLILPTVVFLLLIIMDKVIQRGYFC